MPMRKNEHPILGPWKAERWTWINGNKWAWRNYNRPHHHIHSGEKYEFAYLAKNLKEASQNPTGIRDFWNGDRWVEKPFILRMRNVETGDVLPVAIL